jgi:hypothetical protein
MDAHMGVIRPTYPFCIHIYQKAGELGPKMTRTVLYRLGLNNRMYLGMQHMYTCPQAAHG